MKNKRILIAAIASTLLASTPYALASEASPESTNENPYYNQSIEPIEETVISRKAKSRWLDKKMPFNERDVDQYINNSAKLEKAFKPNLGVNLIKKSVSINPSESQNYPVVITSLGYNTVLTFWDSNGSPWDVEYVANGNQTQFIVDQPENVKYKNILIINPRELLSRTNLTVSLKDEKHPLTIHVVTNDLTQDINSAYGEFSVNLRKRNPNSIIEPTIIDTTLIQSRSDSNVLLAFIDDLPPEKAKSLNIKGQGSDLKGWSFDNNYYIKTTHALVWPPSKSIQRDGSNATVYKVAKSPLLRIANLETGKTVNYEVENVQ